MKKGLGWLLSLVLLATYGLASARAQAEDADFCTQPFQAVCGARQWVSSRRELSFAARKLALRLEASRSPDYREALYRLTVDSITQAEKRDVLGNVATVKMLLGAAIDAHTSSGHLENGEALKMKAVLAQTQVLIGSDLLKHKPGDTRIVNKAHRSYVFFCGVDGLVDNAYSSLGDGEPYVVICPGMVLRSTQGPNEVASAFNAVLRTMAHELGHRFDADKFEAPYRDYLSCLAQNHAEGLRAAYLGGSDSILRVLKTTSVIGGYKVRTHGAEISADYWGNQALVQYLSGIRRDDRLGVLRDALAGLCISYDDGTHPDGKFRIETLLGADTGIREQMGCTPLAPSCAL